jgi:DNA-binding XRE family transcriptional regulator
VTEKQQVNPIKTAREAASMRQNELASAVGIGRSHMSLIESGKRNPSKRVMRAIARALGVPVDAIRQAR